MNVQTMVKTREKQMNTRENVKNDSYDNDDKNDDEKDDDDCNVDEMASAASRATKESTILPL